jgi:RNA polymerase sigma factor (sigma-70 family)
MIMRTMDDRELLEAYARDRSEAAFSELVRRHLSWVYSVALRHTGNQALAQDVAQSVFVLLAQKAGSLRSEIVLGGWLFRTTRFVGNRALRAESRRKTREETAASMIVSTPFPDENEAVWKQLEPFLDQAVAALSEDDREAILLRFYEKKPLLEIGRHLGLSEEAAKKRVSRAIQKMREFLIRRGVAVAGTLLAGLLTEHTVQAAPAALVTSVSKVAALGISSSTGWPSLARETMNAWRWVKLKLIGGVALSFCCVTVWWTLARTPHSSTISDSTVELSSFQIAAEPPAKVIAASPAAPAVAATVPIKTEEGTLRFHVVAKDSGEPVSGAPLAVNTVGKEGWKHRFDLSTDENGSADIPYPLGIGRLDVGVVASGWAARFATWRIDSDPEFPAEYTLRVDRMTNFMGGLLRDDQGQPVADAVVELEFGVSDMAQQENPRERVGFVNAVPATKSDRNGWWTCAVVDPNLRRLPKVRFLHPNFAPTSVPRDSDLWSGKLVTILDRAVTLTGKIMAEDGTPVGGARIEHNPSSTEAIRVEADPQGSFSIAGLPPGDFDFIVTAPGFAQTYIKSTIKQEMEPVEVRLKPGGILRLRLLDEDGNAISNGTVALTGPGGMYMPGLNWRGESGADGRIEWSSAPADTILNLFAAKPSEFAMSQIVVKKADGEEHVIQLHRMFAVSGRVTDARTGELVEGEIKAFPGYGEGANSWYRGETWRSTNGTFKVQFQEAHFPWRFSVEAEGYAPFVSEWLRPESLSVFDVRLQPAAASNP